MGSQRWETSSHLLVIKEQVAEIFKLSLEGGEDSVVQK